MNLGSLFGSLITLTVGVMAVGIMVALAIRAIRTIAGNQKKSTKRNNTSDL